MEARHRPYVNARGELIDNGTSAETWCSWEHRPTCSMCQAMARGDVLPPGMMLTSRPTNAVRLVGS